MKKCEHHWHYERTIYRSNEEKPDCKVGVIRRYCKKCKLIQHSYTTGRWYKSNIGPRKMWDEPPRGHG